MRPEIIAQWPQVSALLDELLPLDDLARKARLDTLSEPQRPLKSILQRLLAKGGSAASFFERLPIEVETAIETGTAIGNQIAGGEVGPYRLLRLIGRGGMSVVWLAQRSDGMVPLPVALKLPFPDAGGAQIAERFQRERQILAALNHPNIARFYEAGVSAENQAYLALEYVEGESLLQYCARCAPSTRERLKLFMQVLRAVQYAHSMLVIHRDLKPSNIIVTTAGDVKLLDFGIAKLLDADTKRTELTALTQTYGRMMTMDFASPEQVKGDPLTTATDVYSLGVILFELLTGSRPYRLKRSSRAQLEDAILLEDCPRPSQAVSPEFAATVGTSATRWARALRGDLDAIVLKALEKNPATRYPTVDAFARDCDLHLQGLPVQAQAPRNWYRFTKFVGRNRVLLVATAAVLLALLAGLGAALWQARNVIAQQQLTAAEASKQRAVQAFMTSLFEKNTRLQANAAEVRGMTVRELLIEASDRVRAAFDETPTVKLEVLNTVARLLREVDEYDRSAQLSRDAIALAKKNSLANSDGYLEALLALSTVARVIGNGAEAIQARDQSLAILDARGDFDSLLRARASINTVAQLAPDAEREIALVKKGAALYEQRYPHDPGYFNALWVLGNLYRTQQDPAQAVGYFQRAIAEFRRTGSRDYTNFGASHGFLALCEFQLGRVPPALAHYAQGLALLDQHAGPNALVTRFHRGIYASMLHQAGHPDEAHRLFAELRANRPPAGPTIVDFDDAVYEASGWLDEGRAHPAQQLLAEFADNWVKFGKAYRVNGERWLSNLALAQALQGQIGEARITLGRLPELQAQNRQTNEPASIDFLVDAAQVEIAAGDLDAAANWLQSGGESADAPPPYFSTGYVRLANTAAAISLRRGNARQALQYSANALQHLQEKSARGGFPYLQAQTLKAQGDALLALNRAPEARQALTTAVDIMRRLQAPNGPELKAAIVALGIAANRVKNPR